ncbi:MAG TPA: hypothetical protein VNE63_01225 [Candidatus Acidoferrales bacterium]|nr:hypothetical protein [Candidatus Acidoferrales bacterium]
MDFHMQRTRNYRVEVSGWDVAGNFFVETATLGWDQNAQKEISLRSPLREGCIVFVRLLDPASIVPNLSIAYQAVNVRFRASDSHTRVCLQQLQPRPPFRERAKDLCGSAVKVA